jgi:Fic family protein
MKYFWQTSSWPEFFYNLQGNEDAALAFAEQTGFIAGMLKAIPEDIRMEAVVNTMAAEAIKTSEIEGEFFSRQDVVSSIRNNLGLNDNPDPIKNKNAEGAGELMVDVRKTYADPLSKDKLFEWHRMLMKQHTHINAGAWRKDEAPMQVVSCTIGKETIHFEAPPSYRVPGEMDTFIQWFNETAPGGVKEIKKAPVRSAIAHLYFETIHPFEDGNGRIGRAIAEKALSQTIGLPVLLSLSQTIEADKKSYYSALEQAQSNMHITEWIKYFLSITINAQIRQKNALISFCRNPISLTVIKHL